MKNCNNNKKKVCFLVLGTFFFIFFRAMCEMKAQHSHRYNSLFEVTRVLFQWKRSRSWRRQWLKNGQPERRNECHTPRLWSISFLSIRVLHLCLFLICLFFPLMLCIHRRATSPLCDTHAPPPPWNFFNHAACLTFLTSLLHFTHCASPFFSWILKSFTCASSQTARPASFGSARKWRQLRMEYGSGQIFDHTTLSCCSQSELHVKCGTAANELQFALLRWGE